MSVVIKGMKMPYGCANCLFCSGPKYNGYGRSEYICNVPVDEVNGRETTDNVLAMFDGAVESFPEFCPLSKAPDSRWIPVTERLPEEKTYVLILADTIAGKMAKVSFIYKDSAGRNCWTTLDEYGKNLFDWQPTHWMPLPEPPQEEEGE